MLRLALTPRWLGFLVFVLVLVTCFVALSAWQVDRAQHKNDTLTAQDVETVRDFNETLSAQVPMPGYLSDQRVSLAGHYLPEAQVLVADRVKDDTEGFWVVTMFAPEGARMGEDAQLADAGADSAGAGADSQGGSDSRAGALGERPLAIPVVRGWVPDEASAADSPPPGTELEMTARLGPVEGPEPAADLPAGQVRTVSSSQLINYFDVYSYSGILFPEELAAAVADPGQAPLEQVVLEREESGGFDLQSAIYALEWIFFAGFALYIWFQLLRDAHRKELAAGARGSGPDGGPAEYVVVKQAGEKDLHAPGAPPAGAPAGSAGPATSADSSEQIASSDHGAQGAPR